MAERNRHPQGEEPYHCAGCGKEYVGERMQCDCATGVGIRRSDGMQIVAEQRRNVTIPFDEYQALLRRLTPDAQNFSRIAAQLAEAASVFALDITDHVPDDHMIETIAWSAADFRKLATALKAAGQYGIREASNG